MIEGVSIPFIAGQWSLPTIGDVQRFLLIKFQSPSLRGSGRFSATADSTSACRRMSQSPSLRGSGRF